MTFPSLMTVAKEFIKKVSNETKHTVAGTVLDFHQIPYYLQNEAPFGLKVKKAFKLWRVMKDNFSAVKNRTAV